MSFCLRATRLAKRTMTLCANRMHEGIEGAHRKHILQLIAVLFVQDALVCQREYHRFSSAHLVSCMPNLKGTQAIVIRSSALSKQVWDALSRHGKAWHSWPTIVADEML